MLTNGAPGGLPPAASADVIAGVRLGEGGLQFSSAALLQLFETIPVAISVTAGPDHRFVYANSRYRRALVPGGADPSGRNMREVFEAPLRPGIYDVRDRVLAQGCIERAIEEPVSAGEAAPMHWDISFFPLRDESEAVGGVLTFAVDVTEKVNARREAERRAAQEKARAEEASLDRARLALAVEATDLGIWEWNVETGVTIWSDRQKAIWGLDPPNEASYDYWRASIHPEDRERVLGTVSRTLDPASGGDQRMEHRIVRPSGAVRWIASRGRMLYEEKTGRPLTLIGTVLDITSRKTADAKLRDALDAKEVLLAEVNHRIKNSLQLVSSMLALQSGRSSDPDTRNLILEAQSRVQVVAAVHERLYRSDDVRAVDLDVFLQTLCADIKRAVTHDDDEIAVEVKTQPVTVVNDRAVPIALILNELLTNAIKYAYPDRRGTIEVTLDRIDEDQAALVVADKGVGLPPDFIERRDHSLGFRIIEGLVRQIQGETEIAARGPGSSVRITFPTGT